MYLRKNRHKLGLVLGAFALSALLAAPASAQQRSLSGKVVSETLNKRDQTPSSISFSTEAGYATAQTPAVLQEYLGMNPATDELRFVHLTKPGDGISVGRYQQYYKGIKVAHGAYTVTSKNDRITYMTGNFYKVTNSPATQPVLAERDAFQKAVSHIGATKYAWDDQGSEKILQRRYKKADTSFMPHGTLAYVEDYTGNEPDGQLHLAYRFDIYALEPVSRTEVYVDAANGKILFTNAILKHVNGTGNSMYSGPVNFETELSGGSYYLHDLTRATASMGYVNTYTYNNSTNASAITELTNATTSWPSGVALDAQWGAEKVYDYWHTAHNRLSWDDMDGSLDNVVHYGNNYNNAFWDGTMMTYGDGSGIANGGNSPLVSLDVCGHEIGHGVCQATCDLIYQKEPGAMNEGFSDIWGAVIENYGDPHETDAKAKNMWEMGEEIGSSPFRSMSNPKLYGQPDTYNGTNWVNAGASCTPNGANDQCGVHTNSGVLNHWFYLLVTGGNGTNDLNQAFAVPGIGITKAAKIAYGTELSLVTTSNYAAARTASINFTTTLYGSCSLELEAVTRAWNAVGVGGPFTPCAPQISFGAPVQTVTEFAPATTCPASHTVNIPVTINGPALTGGNATITVSPAGGTAVNGVDYALNNTTVTFQAGSTAPQNIVMTIFDNGSVDTDKYVDLSFTLAANGSNATVANVMAQERIIITNDDRAPELGGTELHSIGTATVTSNFTSPFFSSTRMARSQFIMTAAELTAGGLRPNMPINSIAFNVTQKNSTQPFTGYTIKLASTTASNFTNAFLTGFTQVYNGNYSSVTGWNELPFSTPFTWNGTSNIAVEICYTNTSAGTSNDRVDGTQSGGMVTAYNSSNSTSATASGCALNFATNNLSNAKPVVRFKQTIPPTPVEMTATGSRNWDVHAGQQVYFFSEADTQLIAAVLNNTKDLGCVTASVTAQGNGFVPAVFAHVNRSVKEFKIAPVQNIAAVNYDAIIYFDNTELGNVNTANVRILKTNAATDPAIGPNNTQVVVPTLVTGQNYTGFRGAFNGFSRFFLVDGNPALAVGSVSNEASGIRVNNNPFHQDISVSYVVRQEEAARIRLYDVAGKLVYDQEQVLQSGQHQLSVATGRLVLAPGYYVLQIVHRDGVFTQRLLKD